MKAVDSRLLGHARAARTYLILTVLLGLVMTGLILAQAALLAHALATAGPDVGVAALAGTLGLLLAVVLVRGGAAYGSELAALRAAARVKSQLRRDLVTHSLRLGPNWIGGQQPGQIAGQATHGLDRLDPYFARYLPQLVLSVVVPVAVVVTVTSADWISGVVIAVTLPLIPLFAALVGMHTKAATRRQWRLLAQLSGHFLDVVQGLPTLKVFRRAKFQEQVIANVTDEHRKATMATLRISFLSAFVLELSAALATAVVAVETGLRLLYGHLPYQTALLVLLLTPEAYLPLRAVAAQYHASAEGRAAADAIFDVLNVPLPAQDTTVQHRAPVPDLAISTIELTDVTVGYPNRSRSALHPISLAIRPGELVMLTGPSGAGKTTLLKLLLRLVQPASGSIRIDGTDLATIPEDWWRAHVSWVPQHPWLFTASVADNIALSKPGASRAAIEDAADLAGAAEFIQALPHGYDTELAEGTAGLSAGQRQQLALARAFLRPAPILLLDEPTAHLSPAAAAAIDDAIRGPLAGRTIVMASHRHSHTEGASQVLRLTGGAEAALPEPVPTPLPVLMANR